MKTRLEELYKQTGGGHKLLSEDDLTEYAALRKREYQAARERLKAQGMRDIHPVKDSAGDIVGWQYTKSADRGD